jgi:hypothetical protein
MDDSKTTQVEAVRYDLVNIRQPCGLSLARGESDPQWRKLRRGQRAHHLGAHRLQTNSLCSFSKHTGTVRKIPEHIESHALW